MLNFTVLFLLFVHTKSYLFMPYLEVPSSPEYPGYYDGDDERGMMRSTASIEASYEHYLRTGVLNFYFLLRLVP